MNPDKSPNSRNAEALDFELDFNEYSYTKSIRLKVEPQTGTLPKLKPENFRCPVCITKA